jgi:hypothetical protein
MILAGQLASAAEVGRFRTEAEAVARLQHPNIVQIHAVGEHDGLPFLALEYVDGGTLSGKLAGRPLPPRQAARLTETLAQAVYHAHERGIVHLDLKPGNVLLQEATTKHTKDTKQGGTQGENSGREPSAFSCGSCVSWFDCTPKITDFGLARRWDEGAPASAHSGVIRGTPSYMAPEQADGGQARAIGRCSDVYALGAVLYEVLTGRPPFRGETPLDTLEQVRTREPVAPRQLQPKVPRDLETICLTCLRKEPGRRYATALELAEDLGRFLGGRPIRARPVGPAGRCWAWCRRQPGKAGLAAALLLAVAGGLIGILYQWRRAEASADLARTEGRNARAQEEQVRLHLREVEAAGQRAEDQARQTRQRLVKCFQVSRAPSLRGPASQPVRLELLVEIEARYRQLLRERGDDRTLRADLAEVTTSLGRLHWDNWHSDQARTAFEEALQVWQGLVREDGRNREYRAGLARAYQCLGWVQRSNGCLLRPRWDYRAAPCIPRQVRAYEEAHRL